MRTAQAARRLLLVQYPEDIEVLRAAIDEDGPCGLSDFEIGWLYEKFSSEEYFAGWMSVGEGMAAAFARWLRARGETTCEES